MQVQSTTRRCSRCKNDLPHSAFGSHNYCRACYREYLDNWKSKNTEAFTPSRRSIARQRLKDGLCVACGTAQARAGTCDHCNYGAQILGIEHGDFEDTVLNIIDYYNGYFDK
jgi:hypothetical protein